MIEIPKNLSKETVSMVAASQAAAIMEQGRVLHSWCEIRYVEHYLDALKEHLREFVLQELPPDGLKTPHATISVQYRKQYDFSDDRNWQEQQTAIETLKAEQKRREEFLKMLVLPIADVTTGEIINPAKLESTKAIITTTLKK